MSAHRYGSHDSARWRRLSPQEVEEHVAQHVERASDYVWYFVPDLPLYKLVHLKDGTSPRDMSREGWLAWLRRERAGDEGERWESDFVHWFTTGGLWEEDGAIVAVEQGSGYGIADGNHRVAVAYEHGMRGVRAYVGRRLGS